MHRIIATSVAFFFIFFFASGTAFAIQGYKDRHGSFYGFGLGGGPGALHADGEDTGLEGTGELGFAPHLVFGGGMSNELIFGAEISPWIRTVSIADQDHTHLQWSFNAFTNYFVLDNLYLEGGLGLAYKYWDSDTRHQEMGISAKIGTGFEYFLDGTVAAGMRFGYTRHFYQNGAFDAFVGAATLRWY